MFNIPFEGHYTYDLGPIGSQDNHLSLFPICQPISFIPHFLTYSSHTSTSTHPSHPPPLSPSSSPRTASLASYLLSPFHTSSLRNQYVLNAFLIRRLWLLILDDSREIHARRSSGSRVISLFSTMSIHPQNAFFVDLTWAHFPLSVILIEDSPLYTLEVSLSTKHSSFWVGGNYHKC